MAGGLTSPGSAARSRDAEGSLGSAAPGTAGALGKKPGVPGAGAGLGAPGAGAGVLGAAEVARNAPSPLEKVFKWLVVAICLMLAAELVWLLGITPFMPFSRIDVSAVEGLTREGLLAQAGITAQSSFFSVDARASERALRALPQVETARVFKHFPDRLEILLQGRKATAVALAPVAGGYVPVYLDSSGVIFRVGGSAEALDLPLISGLDLRSPVPGDRLPSGLSGFFAALETVRLNAPELVAAISEIRLQSTSFDGFELIVYPVHKKIRVRLSELNEELLRYTLLFVDIVADREPAVDLIDFRAGMASYTLKGGLP